MASNLFRPFSDVFIEASGRDITMSSGSLSSGHDGVQDILRQLLMHIWRGKKRLGFDRVATWPVYAWKNDGN